MRGKGRIPLGGSGKKKSHRVSNTILVLILLAGVAIAGYPAFSDYWNSMHQTRAIQGYAERIAELDNEEYIAIWESALDYNRRLAEDPNPWAMSDEDIDDYERQLNVDGTGNMGFISIPRIDVNLPVYHGTSDAVLQTSIGHIAETSLPVGGAGSHCSLSGHRGLPSAKLFSDLDKLIEGDVFTLSILNETYSYEVDRIRVVKPEDLSELRIIPGQDLCTLVTCTPYGINSHRLLVRGHRVKNANGDARVVADAFQVRPVYVAPFIMMFILAGLLIKFVALPSKRTF